MSEPHIIYKQPGNIIVSRQATLENIWADTQKLLHFYFVHMAFEHYNLRYHGSLVQMDFYNIFLSALQVLQINKALYFRETRIEQVPVRVANAHILATAVTKMYCNVIIRNAKWFCVLFKCDTWQANHKNYFQ